MKVLIICLLCFVLFIMKNILQCQGATFTIRDERFGINTISPYNFYCFKAVNTTQVFNGGISALQHTIQYCKKDYGNLTSLAGVVYFNDVIYMFLCAAVMSVATFMLMPIRKILLLRPRTKTMKTKLPSKTKCYQMSAILNSMSIGVIATDSQMKIIYMNSTAGLMCGQCPKTAMGMPIHQIVRFKTEEREHSPKNMVLDCNIRHSKDENLDLILYSNGGRYIEVQQIISPLAIHGEAAGAVTLLLDVTASRDMIRQLNYSASHDALTGLPNRASFYKRLQSVITSEEGLQHALVFVDLDGFKMINDSAGHAAGDELLKQIAQLMQLNLRHSDFVARLGGDEFGIILFNCGLPQAKNLIDILVSIINEYSFCWEGEIKHVGASAGITSVDFHRKNVGKLIAESDEACYEAKHRGKGQVCVFAECKGNISKIDLRSPLIT